MFHIHMTPPWTGGAGTLAVWASIWSPAGGLANWIMELWNEGYLQWTPSEPRVLKRQLKSLGFKDSTSSLEILSFLLQKKWADPKGSELVAVSCSFQIIPNIHKAIAVNKKWKKLFSHRPSEKRNMKTIFFIFCVWSSSTEIWLIDAIQLVRLWLWACRTAWK